MVCGLLWRKCNSSQLARASLALINVENDEECYNETTFDENRYSQSWEMIDTDESEDSLYEMVIGRTYRKWKSPDVQFNSTLATIDR